MSPSPSPSPFSFFRYLLWLLELLCLVWRFPHSGRSRTANGGFGTRARVKEERTVVAVITFTYNEGGREDDDVSQPITATHTLSTTKRKNNIDLGDWVKRTEFVGMFASPHVLLVCTQQRNRRLMPRERHMTFLLPPPPLPSPSGFTLLPSPHSHSCIQPRRY